MRAAEPAPDDASRPATTDPGAGLPTDPDVDLCSPAQGEQARREQRAELQRAPGPVLAAIALGGALGSTARFGVGRAFADPPHAFPWATFTVNVTGCLLIGVLMVLLTDVWTGHRLLRPFLGVGVLGGFTTFSTYTVDTVRLAADGTTGTALAYLVTTLIAALAAVYAGITLTRRWLRTGTRRHGGAAP